MYLLLSLSLSACSKSPSHGAPDMASPGGHADFAVATTEDLAAANDLAPPAGDLPATDGSPPSTPLIVSFTATPNVIPAGATRTVTLAWNVQGASSLAISGIGTVTGTSTQTSVSAATTFTLTATGASGGMATANASVSVAPGIYIDATNGHDTTGNGTAGNPYQTVSKAGSVATGGQTIYAAAGSYPLQTAAVNLADGVGIEALSYGTVTFAAMSGNSYGLTFAGSGFVHGLEMDHSAINVSTGTVNLDGVQFTGFPDSGSAFAGIIATGGKVVVTPGGLTSYIDSTVSSFAYFSGSGQLEIHGGALNNAGSSGFTGSALIHSAGTSQLLLDGVTIDGAKLSAIGPWGGKVTLQNGTLIRNCAGNGPDSSSININNGSPTIVIDNSTITGSPGYGIYVNGGAGAAPSLTLRNGAVIEKSAHEGIYFQFSTTGTLNFNSARISGNGGAGVNLGGGVYTATIRGTQITGNKNDGFNASLSAGSALNFGDGTTAGGNTLSGNNTSLGSFANVNLSANLSAADLIVNAIGNTWDPNIQTADGNGHFPSATTFSAPPTVSGQNVRLGQGGTATYHLSLVATP